MRTSDKDKRRGFVPLLGRAALAVFFCTAFLWRCATIMTPTGGPKDTLPPVITLMTPDNFTTNFKDRKIYIEFDEFVQIKDQQKEFFTSPQMKKKPTITLRGRGISVQLRDTLRENTTYALNFGSAICDNNEGNPLYSMRYVFSTGPEIDSMVLSGYTVDAYKADSVSKSFIYFYIRRCSTTSRRSSPAPRPTAFSWRRTSNRFPTASTPSRIPTTTRCTNRRSTRWVFWTV